jgi:outer membrane lipoprotein-sorting protein
MKLRTVLLVVALVLLGLTMGVLAQDDSAAAAAATAEVPATEANTEGQNEEHRDTGCSMDQTVQSGMPVSPLLVALSPRASR